MTTTCPLNTVMLQRGELVKIERNQTMCPMMLQRVKLLKIKRNQTMCPMMMISAGSLSIMRKSKGKAEVRSHVRGLQKRVVPELRRWQHKARYRTGIAAVEGRECCA